MPTPRHSKSTLYQATPANKAINIKTEGQSLAARMARKRQPWEWDDYLEAGVRFAVAIMACAAIGGIVFIVVTSDAKQQAEFEHREAVNREVERLDAKDRDRKEQLMLRLEAEVERAKRRGR